MKKTLFIIISICCLTAAAGVPLPPSFEIEDVISSTRFANLLKKQKLKAVEVSGELTAVVDDFHPDPNKHKVDYFIRDAKGVEHQVQILNNDLEQMVGSKVSFRGVNIAEGKTGYVIKSQVARTPPRPEVRIEKMLVLLFKFKNSKTTYITHSEMQDWFFNGAFQRFYREMSDNKILHQGSVYPWYALDRDGEDDGSSNIPCLVKDSEIKAAIAAYQIDVTKYDQITMISNCTEYSSIGGRANTAKSDFLGIGHPMTYIKMAGFPSAMKLPSHTHPYVPGWNGLSSILIHERGHNFGLHHSNSLDCGDRPYLQNCATIQYGNTFDRMGGPRGSFLFNAHQQKLAGFKTDQEFLHIKEPGRYLVDKITSKKLNRKIGAYIYHPTIPHQKAFLLEYRTPDGMDANLLNPNFSAVKNGALLYTSLTESDPGETPNYTTGFQIIDARPTALEFGDDTAYESLQGEYFDPKSGVRINVLPPVQDQIQFVVSYDKENSFCGKSNLRDLVSAPYLRLYHEMEVGHGNRDKIPGSDSGTGGGPVNNPVLPPFSKNIKTRHIILLPGDFFHLKFDTLIGEHLICDRRQLEISIEGAAVLQPYFVYSSTTANSFKKNTVNYANTTEYPLLKVPAVELGKDRHIVLRTKDKITGEIMTEILYLHIRSSRNAILK